MNVNFYFENIYNISLMYEILKTPTQRRYFMYKNIYTCLIMFQQSSHPTTHTHILCNKVDFNEI